MTLLAALMSAAIVILLARNLWRRPESPWTVYIVFAIFAGIPIALMLLPTMREIIVRTPMGLYRVEQVKLEERIGRLEDASQGKPALFSADIRGGHGVLQGTNLGDHHGEVIFEMKAGEKVQERVTLSPDSISTWSNTRIEFQLEEQDHSKLELMKKKGAVRITVRTIQGEQNSTPYFLGSEPLK